MSKILKTFHAGLVMAAASALAAPVFAQVPLTLMTLQTRSYESVASWQERQHRPAGIVEVVHVPGHVLVDIRAVFDGPWSDQVDRISVNGRDIELVLPDGTTRAIVGGYGTWGQLSLRSQSLSGRRPRDFPEDDADLYWNGLFVVPKGTTQATLRIGGDNASFEGMVTIPAPTVPEDAAIFARFQPQSVRRFRTVNLEDGRGNAEIRSSITAPAGMVLAEVEVEVIGVASNETDADQRFTWHTHNFRLVDNAGNTLGLVGERFMRRILDSQYNGVDIGASADRTMLWAVPESLTEARLLFGETEVARVNLGAAPVTPTD